MYYEKYNYDKKIPLNKINEMFEILIPFYNKLNGKDNGTDEMKLPFINILQNTKDYNILLCYYNDELIGFINYMYYNDGLMLSEIQIKSKYHGKNILRSMLKKILDDINLQKFKKVFITINSKNTKSINVLTHIGFKNTNGVFYEINIEKLINWVNKKQESLNNHLK